MDNSVDSADSPQTGRELVQWSEKFHTNIREIDEQHRSLVVLLNQLFTATFENRGTQVSNQILDKLVEYALTHFLLEENLMRMSAYPNYDLHKLQHADFVAQVQRFQNKVRSENASISFELLRFLRTWLLQHIDASDKRFGEYFETNGYSHHYASWQQEVEQTIKEKKQWWQFW